MAGKKNNDAAAQNPDLTAEVKPADATAELLAELERLKAENAAYKTKEDEAAAKQAELDAIPYGEQEVEVYLQPPAGRKEPFKYVKINERSWNIPYDEPVKVPRCVAELLKCSAKIKKQSRKRDGAGVVEVSTPSDRL